ncbi:50S ribosomal protein L3 [Candidatus Parcubacteria bacterium]|nr:50S ribosomal protein L3 [Candidatus Parcubacteria bacterium]
MKFILGRKKEMTQLFTAAGTVVPVTVVEAGPVVISQVKPGSVQVAFGKTRHLKKPEVGHLKDLGQFRWLREFRVPDAAAYTRATTVDASIFESGDRVRVSGFSKGRGFQGVVKRHGFGGSPATHGHKHDLRAPGSIGATTPQKVLKGMRMAGRMGFRRQTTPNLEVVKVDVDHNLLYIRGAVPGSRGALLEIRS